MKLIVFGLTVSSSWGNGHATLWRGLWHAWSALGHEIVFFERDVPYYASNRDLAQMPSGELVLYRDWDDVLPRAHRELAGADAAMVTSYCPDGVAATGLLAAEGDRVLKVFYDMDTPVTLENLRAGRPVAYLGARGLRDFDLVLSYTGGASLAELRERLGAREVRTLYGHVDPQVHRRVPAAPNYRCALSYLGTYAADRQAALRRFFIDPAGLRPNHRFLVGGAQYPTDFPWQPNIHFVQHLPPPEHPAFFSSSRLTLNITRQAMADMGWCPSGRLFEAAACGTPILSDNWEGLDSFFDPGQEILIAETTADAVGALTLTDAELKRIAKASRERALEEHTSEHRAGELEILLEGASSITSPTGGSAAMMEA